MEFYENVVLIKISWDREIPEFIYFIVLDEVKGFLYKFLGSEIILSPHVPTWECVGGQAHECRLQLNISTVTGIHEPWFWGLSSFNIYSSCVLMF